MSEEVFTCGPLELVASYSDAEPDVGWPGGIDDVSLWLDDTEIKLPKAISAELEEWALNHFIDKFADEQAERGDWEYEQRKDRFLDERHAALEATESRVAGGVA